MKTVFSIDDHPVVALGLDLALRNAKQFRLIGVASEPHIGLGDLSALRPDCVILDLVFSGSIQIPLIADCRTLLAEAVIIVFSSLSRKAYEHKALQAGADAYMTKDSDLTEVVARLEDLCAQPRAARSTMAADVSPAQISEVFAGVVMTPREAQIAASVGRGLSVTSIATQLGLSPNTVAAHRENIRRKLNCRDTKELVARLARSELE